MTVFEKDALDALFAELAANHADSPEYDQLLRDAHLAIALSDAGKPFDNQVDDRITKLIATHK